MRGQWLCRAVLVCAGLSAIAFSSSGKVAPGAEPAGSNNLDTVVERLRTKVFSSDISVHDCFGRSVALSGAYLVVGSKGQDDFGSDAGAAYVFKKIDGDWVEQARLTASDAEAKDFFGFSVSIDGETIVVGAWAEDGKDEGAGAAYVFEMRGDRWVETAKLMASDATPYAHFGYDVAINGNTVLVGARKDRGAGPLAGAAYVYERRANTWIEAAKLTPVENETSQFGIDVAVGDDILVVGAMGRDAAHPGSVYVFERSGDDWTRKQILTAMDAEAQDNFGYSVAVSEGTILVGATGKDDGANPDAGAAYIFERAEAGWTGTAKLTASDATAQQRFGWSVGISGDRIVLGAWGDAVYVFNHGGEGWREGEKLLATVDPPVHNLFGFAVAIDEGVIAIGSRLDDDKATEGGAVYLR